MIIKVNKIGNDQEGYTADIDFNIYTNPWSKVGEEDGMWLVEVTKRPEIVAKENEAIRASSQLVVAERLLNESLPLDRVEEFASVFDYPVAGQTYKRDWVLRDRETDELFKIIQPQVRWEAHWRIADIPAIVTRFRPADEPSEVQWVANLQVKAGETVIWNNEKWEVIQSHTTQAGWTPNVVPALFRKLS